MVKSSRNRFTVVSTFSGCGGSSLGYQLAGGKVLLAVEMNDNAVETYRLNFKDTPIYHGDIAKLSVEECCELSGIEPGELDILDGSPPCQGFSTVGKRKFTDSRNQLFKEYARLLRGLRPKVFVMENVSGMVKGKMKLIFVECLRELKASGYKVKAKLLNAMYYNVPQSRQRLIFVGVRDDLEIDPGHPKAFGKPISIRSLKIGDGRRVPPKSSTRIFKSGRYRELRHSKPAPTLMSKDGGFQNDGLYWRHGETLIEVSPQERMRFSSYPDGYKFVGIPSTIAYRIGDSVPPNFMRAIAEHIRDNILKLAKRGMAKC